MLSTLQHHLVSAILGDAKPADQRIRPGGTLSTQEAFSIYRESYYARMTEALGEEFESIWWVLGDEDFFRVCREYIASHPSQVDNLQHYGREFGEFLAKHPVSQEFPFLTELATFESKIKTLFHSKSHASLDPATLIHWSEGDFARAKLKLGSGLSLYESRFGVYALWRHRKTTLKENLAIAWEQPEQGVIYLKDQRVHVLVLDPIQFAALGAIRRGADVAQITEQMGQPERIGPFFELLFREGWIAALEPVP